VKREVLICLAIVCAALLVNAGTRYYAARREKPDVLPVVGAPERSPEMVSRNSTPAGAAREPLLRGDLLVLVLQTRPAEEADAWLARELETFHGQTGRRERLLGGSIYLLDGTGKARPWAPGRGLMAGLDAFDSRDLGDFRQTFTTVRAVLDDFGRRAQQKSFHTLLVWRSDLYLDPETDLDGVARPGRPLMLFWVDRLAESPAIDAWLGKGAITPVERGKGRLAAAMDFYVRSLAK
jgi:hypothetical protein